MERLTFFENGRWWIMLNEHMYGGFPEVDRLAAYEDTMPLERAQKLAQAEKDGRLVVLPCRIGDRLYRTSLLWEEKVLEIEVDRQFISSGMVTLFAHTCFQDAKLSTSYECFKNSDIGKTVFLTREEAEAALKKREAGNEAD